MTLLTMAIPDNPAELPRWLERRLMAPDFRRFLAELTAHFPTIPGAAPPQKLFNQWLPKALAEGFDPLPFEVVHQLLKHPKALAAFQERIVVDGGVYWDDVADRTDELSDTFAHGKQSLERIFATDAPPSISKAPVKKGAKAVPSEVVKRTGGRGYKIWALASSGIAACLAIVVGYFVLGQMNEKPVPKAQVAWGWGKPTGLAMNETNPKDYLNKLAENAEEWSQHQPTDAAGVGTRIAELRMGCTRLMHSSYGPLSEDDKKWLLEHCREWAKKLDAHQQALDSGTAPLTVRNEMDETIRSIAVTLREKAAQLG